MDIKKIFLKNDLIEDLWYFNRLRKDSDLKNWMYDYDNSTSIIKFEQLGVENKDRLIFLIEFDKPEFGFFAYWRFGLIGLAFAERYKLEPVINWTKYSPYYEKNGVDGKTNPFEYYFEPISDISIATVSSCYNVARFGRNTKGDIKTEYNDEYDKSFFAELVKKYYVIKKPLKEKMDGEIDGLIGKRKTLGVQIRGVDWGHIQGHPIPPSLEKYVEEIDKAIEQCGFEQIFLATDAEETVEYIFNKYSGKVVVYSDVARAPKGSKTLAIFDSNIKRENNNFLLGYEVLRDMITLSECEGLIASYSNISFAAELMKCVQQREYDYIKIINSAICKNGVSPEKAIRLQRQGKFKG